MAKSISGTLDLGDHVSHLLDSFHLFPKILCFQKVTEMSISFAVRSLVEVKKTLVDSFLQLQGSLHGLQRSAPLHAAWLGNILEDNSSPTPGQPPWPPEECPTPCCLAWQYLGRQLFLHAWLGRSSASFHAHVLHWSSSGRKKRIH